MIKLKNGELFYQETAINIPILMMPEKFTDMFKWSVVACDQYTSQINYWNNVENIVGSDKSTYKLMLPEVYLEDFDVDDKITNINKTMKEYVESGFLQPNAPSLMLVERKTHLSPARKGILMAVDLEKYDYTKGSGSLIRATEGTVLERIPPRMKIRKNACIETPHIMLLIDDPEKTVIEPLVQAAENGELGEAAYDFELMMNGGHIKGYQIFDEEIQNKVSSAINKLAQPQLFHSKYNLPPDVPVLLFAVGDGNHSLASAKSHWEQVKKSCDDIQHPARFALVEVLNVHDEGLVFEPIHRVLFNINANNFIDGLKDYFGEKVSIDGKIPSGWHVVPFLYFSNKGIIAFDCSIHTLAVGALQEYIDYFTKNNPSVSVDYIHGDDVVTNLASQSGNMGFYLPAMNKNDLFKTVILNGALPRKTFSMGEAEEKRFYLECRKII